MHFLSLSLLFASNMLCAEAIVISHSSLPSYTNNNNTIIGLATAPLGAQQSEVWQASIAVGSQTPAHTHEAEEIVILQAGKLEALIEESSIKLEGYKLKSVLEQKSLVCEAPCTIILPANKTHILKNIGDIPTNHYLIMPLGSKIKDTDNNLMTLPWRR